MRRPRPFRLGRRAVLRGMGLGGVSVALPTLDAMLDDRGWVYRGARAAGPLPVRLLTFFFPNGWTGSGAGEELTITSRLLTEGTLKPLAGSVVAVNNLKKDPLPALSEVDGGGGHGDCHGTFATGYPIYKDGAGGPSIDCIAAERHGGDTKFRSLAVALGGPHEGGLGHNNMSWSAKATPVPAERDPTKLFDRLFTSGGAAPPTARDYRKSVLDYVRADLKRLTTRLGTTDRVRLDQYASNLRDLEQTLIAPATTCATPAAPGTGLGNDIYDTSKARGQALIRLLVTAVQCDLTRYASFQNCSSANGRQYPWLGFNDIGGYICGPNSPYHVGHHGLSHQTDPASRAMLVKICFDEVDDFAYMLTLMQQAKEGAGTLLDNSILFVSNEIQNGGHGVNAMPVLVAGGAGGRLKGGRSLDARGKNYNTVLCSVLNYAGVATDRFGLFNDAPLAGL